MLDTVIANVRVQYWLHLATRQVMIMVLHAVQERDVQ